MFRKVFSQLLLSFIFAEEHIVNFKMNDNVPKDTVIGNVLLKSNVKLPRESYHIIVSSSSYQRFSDFFNVSKTGEITTKKFIDRDNIADVCGPLNCCTKEICDFSLRVIFTFHSSKSVLAFVVNLEIIDENDNAPQFSQSQFTINVLEEQPHYRMSLPTAYDLDSSINGVYNYSLTGVNTGKFQLSLRNGYPELLLLAPLDYENFDERRLILVLSAYDRGGKSEGMQLTIMTIDINDNSPIFENKNYKINIKENTSYDEPIAIVKAFDKDDGDNAKIKYKFTLLTPTTITEKFHLNSSTGELWLIKLLDYEVYSDKVLELEIEAADKGSPQLTGSSKIEITTIDINDNFPKIEVLKNISIPENKAVSTPVLSLYVLDEDTVDNKVTCYNVNSKQFRFDTSQEHSVIVYTDMFYDYENTSLVSLDIRCSDSGIPPKVTEKSLYIAIVDENDNAPKFERLVQRYQFFEDTKKGEILFRSSATDADSGIFGEISYRLDLQGLAYFSINKTSAEIYLTEYLDREKSSVLNFLVFATDGGGLESSAKVSVTVLDINDNPPLLKSNRVFNVLENTESMIGKIDCIDLDEGENGRVVIEIDGENNSPFHDYLKLVGNQIYTKTPIDRETISHIYVKLKLIDNGRPRLTTTETITINVIDENDNDPKLISPKLGEYIEPKPSVYVSTNYGTQVLVLRAEDRDFEDNGKIFFKILPSSNGSRFFNVNATLGEIYTTWSCKETNYINCPTPGIYRLEVELKDGNPSPRFYKSHFYIRIYEFREAPFPMGYDNQSYIKNVIILILVIIFSIVLAIGLIGAIVWARNRPHTTFNNYGTAPTTGVKKLIKPNSTFLDSQYLSNDQEAESHFLTFDKSNFTSGAPPINETFTKLYSNIPEETQPHTKYQTLNGSHYSPVNTSPSSGFSSTFLSRMYIDDSLSKQNNDQSRFCSSFQSPQFEEKFQPVTVNSLETKPRFLQEIPDFLKDSRYSRDSYYTEFLYQRNSGIDSLDKTNNRTYLD